MIFNCISELKIKLLMKTERNILNINNCKKERVIKKLFRYIFYKKDDEKEK